MDSRAGRAASPNGEPHYFATTPATPSQPVAIELHLPDLSLRLTTDAGVFAKGAVDPGTKLLLLETAGLVPTTGALLDLGCGYGPVAVTLARRGPDATVWAVDVNERARSLCAANAEANGCANVMVAAPDEVPDVVTFTAIVSNPPIRIGKLALHDLLLRWLPRLEPAAAAWLVVQKHLGSDSLARWLGEQGWPVERVASRQGYRVLRVARAAA